MPSQAYDAVFVGAGINSLAAAFLLGKAGWSVLVVDRNREPGGAIRTMELTLPGFRHDIGAMNLSALTSSPFYREHGDTLREKGLELITADAPFGSLVAAGKFLGITTDRASNLREIERIAPGDAAAWRQWSDDFDACVPFLAKILQSPAAVSGPLEVVFGTGLDIPAPVRPVLKGILLDSLRANLSVRFSSDAVRTLIAAWGLHLDYAPDIAGGCWMPFLETNGDERNGIPLAKGGSGRLIGAMCEMVREVGGELRTGQTVQEIILDGGHAVGIRLADGEPIRAARAVIASVTPPALLSLTGGQLPAATAARSRSWRFGPGTMVIHLALSGLPEWRAGDAARQSFYVHIGPTLDDLAAAYQLGLAGQLTDAPFCVVGQPTRYDPSRAPAGRHVLWVMVRAVPYVIRGDVLGKLRGPHWTDAVKEAFADRVLQVIEGHAPGFLDKILAKAVISPHDLEGLNPNLGAGDLNAGSMHLDQFYGHRPFMGGSRTPLPGLYLCGAATWPGGGAHPGSGMLVSHSLLQQPGR